MATLMQNIALCLSHPIAQDIAEYGARQEIKYWYVIPEKEEVLQAYLYIAGCADYYDPPGTYDSDVYDNTRAQLHLPDVMKHLKQRNAQSYIARGGK